MAVYFDAALEDGDPAVIMEALGDISRTKGTSQTARSAGLGRKSVYKALSPTGNPRVTTVLKFEL